MQFTAKNHLHETPAQKLHITSFIKKKEKVPLGSYGNTNPTIPAPTLPSTIARNMER